MNWGCIPTKALLRSAEIFHYLKHARDYGLSADNVAYDPAAVVRRSRDVSQRLNDGVGFLLQKNKVAVIWGDATVEASGKVTVKAGKSDARKGVRGPGVYQAKHIIIATGARPRILAGIEPDKRLVWTYFEPWRRRGFRNLCSSSARALLASSSHRFIARSAPK